MDKSINVRVRNQRISKNKCLTLPNRGSIWIDFTEEVTKEELYEEMMNQIMYGRGKGRDIE